MAGLWYRVGTVSVTNGSKKVTGFGTKWKTSVSKPDKGHPVHAPDGRIYELDYVESDTVLWLVSSYAGATAADQTYAIDITRTGTVPAFSRDLSSFVAYHQLQMDGWQQLLTGTGDVMLTAPDGTKLTVPSWEKIMNAGTGVVAQAKAEADRAKAEASKSEAHATAAGDVVAASALPLPDVWAPLSDSLRLITGYGRDVLVGSDVVARMVNFSRSTTKTYRAKDGTLKVAAVNEPAFEAEGLLMEGQSTNIVPSSEGTTFNTINTSFHNIANNIAGVLPIVGQRVTFLASAGETNAGVVQFLINAQGGTTYTFSFFIKQESGTVTPLESVIDVYTPVGVSAQSRKVVKDFGGGICRVSLTFTTNGSGSISLYPRLNKQGNDQKVFVVGGCQVEALPFASSYIPTNGAAVTRAADRAWILSSGNIGRVATVSVIAHPLNPANMPRAFVFGASGFGGVEASGSNYLFTGVGQSSTYVAIGPEATARVFARRATAVTFGVGTRTAVTPMEPGGADWGDVIHIGGVLTAGVHKLPFWGHLRDFKIWMEPRNLTDTQLKAIA